MFQAPGSNALDVAAGVQRTMTDLSARFPTGLAYAVTLDTTRPVTAGIGEIVETIVIAMLLVTLVVYVFLQNWRATLIPMIAVPVSLIGTFAFFPVLGFSINTLSLFGLVLAIGLVVDDAIVVVEAVQHHIEEGLSPRAAALLAMKEVSGPVVAIALVLSRCSSRWRSWAASRAGSTRSSRSPSPSRSSSRRSTRSPCLAALWPRSCCGRGESRRARWPASSACSTAPSRGARAATSASARRHPQGGARPHRPGGFGVADGLMGKQLPSSFLPDEDQGYLYVNVMLQPAASLERTDEAAARSRRSC